MARRRSLIWVTILSLSACALVSLWRLAGVHHTTGISLRAAANSTPPEPVFVCPRCDDLFTKLDRRSKNHKGKQEIGIQLRGEPKVKRTEEKNRGNQAALNPWFQLSVLLGVSPVGSQREGSFVNLLLFFVLLRMHRRRL